MVSTLSVDIKSVRLITEMAQATGKVESPNLSRPIHNPPCTFLALVTLLPFPECDVFHPKNHISTFKYLLRGTLVKVMIWRGCWYDSSWSYRRPKTLRRYKSSQRRLIFRFSEAKIQISDNASFCYVIWSIFPLTLRRSIGWRYRPQLMKHVWLV